MLMQEMEALDSISEVELQLTKNLGIMLTMKKNKKFFMKIYKMNLIEEKLDIKLKKILKNG